MRGLRRAKVSCLMAVKYSCYPGNAVVKCSNILPAGSACDKVKRASKSESMLEASKTASASIQTGQNAKMKL